MRKIRQALKPTVTQDPGDGGYSHEEGGGYTGGDGATGNSQLADMPAHTFKANNTAAAGPPDDITVTEATAELNEFTATLKGLVPPPGSATGKVLLDDGTWASVTVAVPTAYTFPTTHTATGYGGWSNAANAYSDNGVYAYIAADYHLVQGDFGGFGFDSLIPAGRLVSSVTIEFQSKWASTGTPAAIGAQIMIGGVAHGTELVNSSDSTTDTTVTATFTGISRANLLDANFKIRIRAQQSAMYIENAYLDYIKVKANYSSMEWS